MRGKRGVIAVARNKLPKQGREGDPSKLVGTEKRTGAKRAKRDIIQPPSEPDAKAVIGEDTMGLISQAKNMGGSLIHPECANSNDGFGAIMTQIFLTYVAHGGIHRR